MFYGSQFGRFSKPRITTPSSHHKTTTFARSGKNDNGSNNNSNRQYYQYVICIISIKSDYKMRKQNTHNGIHAHNIPSRFSYTTRKENTVFVDWILKNTVV